MDPEEYSRRLKVEVTRFSDSVNKLQGSAEKIQRAFVTVPVFVEAYKLYAPVLLEKMPHWDLRSYIIEHADKSQDETRLISLGCGTGDWEIELAEKSLNKIKVDLVEITDEVLRHAREYVEKNNLLVNIIIQDVNKLELKEGYYDFVLVRCALHHFIELEHIYAEIKKSLRPNGKFLVMGEVIGRNGQLLYEETRKEVQKIMEILPEKFRFNHNTKTVDEKFPDIDYSKISFEAIRSEDILPLITKYFKSVEYVTFDAFISYLLDFRYGPNYDLNQKLDKAIFELIVSLDMYYLEKNILKPTCLFGIYEKK